MGVSTTAAEVASCGIFYVFQRGIAVVIQKVGTRHHHSRGAIPTLRRIVLDKGLLHRMQVAIFRNSFNGSNFFVTNVENRHHTGIDRFAVNVNGTGRTGTPVTHYLGTCELQVIPQG